MTKLMGSFFFKSADGSFWRDLVANVYYGNEQFIAHSREDIPYLLSELERQTEELSLAEDEAQYYRSWCDDDPQWSELHKQLQLHKEALSLASIDLSYRTINGNTPQYWLDKAKEVTSETQKL